MIMRIEFYEEPEKILCALESDAVPRVGERVKLPVTGNYYIVREVAYEFDDLSKRDHKAHVLIKNPNA